MAGKIIVTVTIEATAERISLMLENAAQVIEHEKCLNGIISDTDGSRVSWQAKQGEES